MQAAGSVAGGALDTMGAAFSALVPSSVSEWTADKAEEFFQTEPGRKAAELLMSGQKKWDEFERSIHSSPRQLAAQVTLLLLWCPRLSSCLLLCRPK